MIGVANTPTPFFRECSASSVNAFCIRGCGCLYDGTNTATVGRPTLIADNEESSLVFAYSSRATSLRSFFLFAIDSVVGLDSLFSAAAVALRSLRFKLLLVLFSRNDYDPVCRTSQLRLNLAIAFSTSA